MQKYTVVEGIGCGSWGKKIRMQRKKEKEGKLKG